MKKLLFLGGPIFQLPIIEKAKEMGLRIGVVDIDKGAPARGCADDFFCTSILDKEAVFDIVEQYEPSGVICGACDTSVQTAAYVCEKFCLPGNSVETARKATNKLLMLKAFSLGGAPHPKYQYIARASISNARSQLPYPLISKPTDSSGSRGINLISCQEEYFEKVANSSLAGRSGDVLLEEYLVGDEISVEVIVCEGIPHVLQVTDKITTGAPHFCEIGHSQPAVLSQDLRSQVEDVASRACRAVGLQNSPAHIEIKLTQRGPVLIELGARMAGDTISTLLINHSLHGINMSEMAIRIALGEKFEVPAFENKGDYVAIRFIGSHKGELVSITGTEEVKESIGVKDVALFGKEGMYYSVSNSNSDRVGYVIATAKTKREALERCQKAIEKLHYEWKE